MNSTAKKQHSNQAICKISKLMALAILSSMTLFVACKPNEPIPEPEQGEYWNATDDPYGIAVNPYNGDLIITTNGGNLVAGDCYVYDFELKKRLNAATVGMFPSAIAAIDADRFLVLNEGSWGANNASLSLVDANGGNVINNWFSQHNGRGLGDIAQDINIYGTKTYVCVSFSNSFEAINTSSGTSTRFSTEEHAQKPRYMAADGGNVYISCYSPACVLRFDTATQSFTGSCAVGNFNPEGICALDGKLYVCSSNISDENYNYSYNNKLYVIDINSFSLCDSITVGYNPSKVKVLDDNHLVVNNWGDYENNEAGTWLIDVNSKSASKLDITFYNFDTYRGNIYGYTSPYDGGVRFYKMNPIANSRTEILARP